MIQKGKPTVFMWSIHPEIFKTTGWTDLSQISEYQLFFGRLRSQICSDFVICLRNIYISKEPQKNHQSRFLCPCSNKKITNSFGFLELELQKRQDSKVRSETGAHVLHDFWIQNFTNSKISRRNYQKLLRNRRLN